jgi:hypothetical protein
MRGFFGVVAFFGGRRLCARFCAGAGVFAFTVAGTSAEVRNSKHAVNASADSFVDGSFIG